MAITPEEVVTLFPGSIEEYEKFKGYQVEIVDTGGKNKGIVWERHGSSDRCLLFQLINDDGVEALVNASRTMYHANSPASFYGLPVRKKR